MNLNGRQFDGRLIEVSIRSASLPRHLYQSKLTSSYQRNVRFNLCGRGFRNVSNVSIRRIYVINVLLVLIKGYLTYVNYLPLTVGLHCLNSSIFINLLSRCLREFSRVVNYIVNSVL